MHACSPIMSVPVDSIVPSTLPSTSSLFRNLTEPLIETPRERRAPDCVGMDVWLEGPGTTDGSGRFVYGGFVRSRGAKWSKGCIAKIVRNYLTSREAKSVGTATSTRYFLGNAMIFVSSSTSASCLATNEFTASLITSSIVQSLRS